MNIRLGCLLAALLLAACTRNTLIIVEPHSTPALSPCRHPPEAPPTAPTALPNPSTRPDFPPLARQDGVSGCAGFLFRLTPDGRAFDVRLMRELPPGYGFADAAYAALTADVFHPVPGDNAWHYSIYNFSVRPRY